MRLLRTRRCWAHQSHTSRAAIGKLSNPVRRSFVLFEVFVRCWSQSRAALRHQECGISRSHSDALVMALALGAAMLWAPGP